MHKQFALQCSWTSKNLRQCLPYSFLSDLKYFIGSTIMLKTLGCYMSKKVAVKFGQALSRVHLQPNGVPQGGGFSCTLFIVKMNSLQKALLPSISCPMHVVDLQIYFKSCNLPTCQRRIQLGVSKRAGGQIKIVLNSTEKTVLVYYSPRAGIRPDPDIKLNRLTIPAKKEQKFVSRVLYEIVTFIHT